MKYHAPIFHCTVKNSLQIDLVYSLHEKMYASWYAIREAAKKCKKKKFLWPLSRGGGAKSLSGRATKKRTFFCVFPELMHFLQTRYNLRYRGIHREGFRGDVVVDSVNMAFRDEDNI